MTARNGLHALLETGRALQHQGASAVMATVIATEGSTYRKAGARMLLHADGAMTGILGGGCFEGDLAERARAVLEDGRCRVVRYDMRGDDDVLWGLGLGCNGAVDILLQRLSPEDDYLPLDLLEGLAEAGGSLLTLARSEHPAHPAGSCWSPESPAEDRPPVTDPVDPGLSEVRLDGHTLLIHRETIRPPLRLLVCGGGPDALPLVEMADALGWRIAVTDHRPAYLEPARFPQRIRTIPFESRLPPLESDAAVIMSHNFPMDLRYLRELAPRPLDYIGVLGPIARRKALLDELGADGGSLAQRLRGPVGLALGGELPEEIALSTVAEIQAVLHERDARPLGRPGA